MFSQEISVLQASLIFLNLSSKQKCSRPLNIFVALFWTCSNTSRSSRAGHNTEGGVLQQSRVIMITPLDLLVTPLFAQPRLWFPFWAASTLSGHKNFFAHQYLQVFLQRATLNPFIPHPVLVLMGVLTQMQDLASDFVERYEFCMTSITDFLFQRISCGCLHEGSLITPFMGHSQSFKLNFGNTRNKLMYFAKMFPSPHRIQILLPKSTKLLFIVQASHIRNAT